MGTNYYLTEKAPCPHCGRQDEPLHIGKSSFGWVFMLRVYPDRGINTLDDWKRLFYSCHEIKDEYGETVTPDEMLIRITNRSSWSDKPASSDWHYANDSEQGPVGLVRPRRNEYIKYPANESETYVLCSREFS